MKRPIDFTPREQFLLSYYRDRGLSGRRWQIGYTLIILASIGVLLALYFATGDKAWLFFCGAMILYRGVQQVWSEFTYGDSFSGIVSKYEERIAELEAQDTEQ